MLKKNKNYLENKNFEIIFVSFGITVLSKLLIAINILDTSFHFFMCRIYYKYLKKTF